MKTLYKFNYNIICDNINVKMYDCKEVGATYESVDSGRRFAKNSLNSLKKVEGGYEMVGDSYEQGMVLFAQKIINSMEDSIEQYKLRTAECKLIMDKVGARRDMYMQSMRNSNEGNE